MSPITLRANSTTPPRSSPRSLRRALCHHPRRPGGRTPRRLPTPHLLAALRRYARKVRGRPFFPAEFNQWPDRPFSADAVKRRFGTWRNGLRAVGLEPGHTQAESPASPAQLIDELERLYNTLGRAPTANTIARLGRFSPSSYTYRWGSLTALRRRFDSYRRGQLTRAQLISTHRTDIARRQLGHKLRLRILRRDRFRCVWCGQSPRQNPRAILHVDHIRPILRGGQSTLPNLRTLCRECNLGRRNRISRASVNRNPRLSARRAERV